MKEEELQKNLADSQPKVEVIKNREEVFKVWLQALQESERIKRTLDPAKTAINSKYGWLQEEFEMDKAALLVLGCLEIQNCKIDRVKVLELVTIAAAKDLIDAQSFAPELEARIAAEQAREILNYQVVFLINGKKLPKNLLPRRILGINLSWFPGAFESFGETVFEEASKMVPIAPDGLRAMTPLVAEVTGRSVPGAVKAAARSLSILRGAVTVCLTQELDGLGVFRELPARPSPLLPIGPLVFIRSEKDRLWTWGSSPGWAPCQSKPLSRSAAHKSRTYTDCLTEFPAKETPWDVLRKALVCFCESGDTWSRSHSYGLLWTAMELLSLKKGPGGKGSVSRRIASYFPSGKQTGDMGDKLFLLQSLRNSLVHEGEFEEELAASVKLLGDIFRVALPQFVELAKRLQTCHKMRKFFEVFEKSNDYEKDFWDLFNRLK